MTERLAVLLHARGAEAAINDISRGKRGDAYRHRTPRESCCWRARDGAALGMASGGSRAATRGACGGEGAAKCRQAYCQRGSRAKETGGLLRRVHGPCWARREHGRGRDYVLGAGPPIARRYRTAVLVIDHDKKDGEDSRYGPRQRCEARGCRCAAQGQDGHPFTRQQDRQLKVTVTKDRRGYLHRDWRGQPSPEDDSRRARRYPSPRQARGYAGKGSGFGKEKSPGSGRIVPGMGGVFGGFRVSETLRVSYRLK
jgi:hypothetical protein